MRNPIASHMLSQAACGTAGTHVAGTVGGLTYGPAKNSSLLAIRSLECLGNGTVTQVSMSSYSAVPSFALH